MPELLISDKALDAPVIEALGVPGLYMEGHPKQLRADCKAGKFNLGGKTALGSELTFQPVAYRFFADDILGLGAKEWAEVFFFDSSGHLCALMFHGFSRENLENMASELFYDQVALHEVVLTATMSKKTNEKLKAKYYIVEFTYEIANKETTEEIQAWAENERIYRVDTLTATCEYQAGHRFWIPERFAQEEALEAEPVNS